jgi:hypothetical protein
MPAACALILSACSSDNTGGFGDLYGVFSQIVLGGGGGGVTLQQAAAIPFATIGVRIDGGSEGILALAVTNPGDERLWTSASRVALLTKNGRIIRTAGLEHNLTDARIRAGQPGAPGWQAGAISRWEMDFADLNLYSVLVTCQAAVHGQETIKNFSVSIPAIRVDETCRSEQLDWTFVNSYWIAGDGRTWRSIQYVSPKLGPIEVEILRPPA